MSEPQKTVEETPVQAPAETIPVENTTAAAAAAATETAEAPKETPAANTEANPAPAETPADQPKEQKDEQKDQPKDEQKESKEVTPASEGVLGYKAPGLVKGLRFSKRFVYFQDEPVDAKHLHVFHQNEKPAVANPVAAWATQTGKGLLFLTKRAEDKATPASIFCLADIGDIAKEGNEFHFKVNGHKHTFQAVNAGERDSWLAALEAKAATAKAEKETITSGEGYKAELEKLTKPAEVAKKPAENKEAKKEEPKKEEAKDEAKDASKDAKEEPKKEAAAEKNNSKSRSQSRKRTSIFGTLLGKKEEAEPKEEKKEEKKEDKPEEAKPEGEAPAEIATETPAEAAPAASEQKEEKKEEKKDDKEEKKEENKEEKKEEKEEKKDDKKTESQANQKSKRSSIFGNFFQKVSSPTHEKSEKEAAAPAETSVASTAPQLDNPVEEAAVKPIEPESVTSPTNGEAPKEGAAESPAAETPSGAKDKRRTSFFGSFGMKKEKKGDSDNETDGESKPKNKLGGIFRKPSKAVKMDKETPAEENKPEPVSKEEPEAKAEAKADDKPAEKPTEEITKPAETAATTEEAKPANVASTSTTVEAAA